MKRIIAWIIELTVYNRLALGVTCETLTDVYLGYRRAVEMEERAALTGSSLLPPGPLGERSPNSTIGIFARIAMNHG